MFVYMYIITATGRQPNCSKYLFTYSMEQSPSLRSQLVLQLIKKFPAFYGTRKFTAVLTSARHLSLSVAVNKYYYFKKSAGNCFLVARLSFNCDIVLIYIFAWSVSFECNTGFLEDEILLLYLFSIGICVTFSSIG